MDSEEIEKAVSGKAVDLIEFAKKNGIDFSDMGKDFGRTFVKERFSFTEKQFDSVDFVFWIAYFVEREAGSMIIDHEIHMGARKEAMESVVGKLHFGDKIKIIEELHASKSDPFVKMMRKIQDLRNSIAHGRFEDLEYGGYGLDDSRGQLILVGDLRDSLLKKS